jgi:hypothetical protein
VRIKKTDLSGNPRQCRAGQDTKQAKATAMPHPISSGVWGDGKPGLIFSLDG